VINAPESKTLKMYREIFGNELTYENISKLSSSLFSFLGTSPEKKIEKIKADFSIIREQAISRLESIFKAKLPERVDIYLTTLDRCTYHFSDKGYYFFVSALGRNTNLNIVHELIHLFTYLRFKNEMEKIDNQKLFAIKESLTELINLGFPDLNIGEDTGYPGHEKAREEVRRVWQNTKDIDKVFETVKEIV